MLETLQLEPAAERRSSKTDSCLHDNVQRESKKYPPPPVHFTKLHPLLKYEQKLKGLFLSDSPCIFAKMYTFKYTMVIKSG